MIDHTEQSEWSAASSLATPFAEISPSTNGATEPGRGIELWAETATPFADVMGNEGPDSESYQLYADTLAELQDEEFDEAVETLADETEQSIYDRFNDEMPSTSAERERFAEAHLSAVGFEAEQYLDALESGISGLDVDSLTADQLDEVLNRYDARPDQLTPAGEEFIGAIARKAKRAVKTAVNVGKQIGKLGSKLLAPVLQRLRALIKPLLQRVLSFAIGKLPMPLQPAARTLAARLTSESHDEGTLYEGSVSPTSLTDVEMLAFSLDEALAEVIAGGSSGEPELEFLDGPDRQSNNDGRQLEYLAEARGTLIEQLGTSDNLESVVPSVEQFVPALLGALKLGIKLAGRPKVVSFLARYLAQSIGRWIGPAQSGPLSNAIVDTGLRLVSLEAEQTDSRQSDPAGPVALASVVEDTVRRLTEQEDFVLDNEDLMQLAASEAFSQAVASHFPAQFVRPALQQAPSLGGTFVARRQRSVRPYSKYSRVPNVEITEKIADTLPSFGGNTVGDTLRARGAKFPFQARMHIYQAKVGTNLPRIAKVERVGGLNGRSHSAAALIHPLTPAAAGLLLREPQLGVTVPAAYLRSKNRIAVGQRFYIIEPIGAAASLNPGGGPPRPMAGLAPSRSWIAVNRQRKTITVGFYFSEVDSQQLVEAIRQGRGSPALLQALVAAYQKQGKSLTAHQGTGRVSREDGEDFEDFVADVGAPKSTGYRSLLQRRISAWVLPALAAWTRTNVEAFLRAAAHPSSGVTIRVRLTSVPGLDPALRSVPVQSRGRGAISPAVDVLRSQAGTPAVAITVAPGRGRR